MNSRQWDNQGWQKYKNPSSEVVRKKEYERYLPSYSNTMPENINVRKQLARILEIPKGDLMGELDIVVKITKHKYITLKYNLIRQ